MSDLETLLQAAREAQKRAYAPYSRFAVGAALLTASGKVFIGCNVENASYGLALCAERVAIGSAVAAGERDFVAMAVVAPSPGPVSPCGMCRQTMVEFNPKLRLILANLQGEVLETTAGALLPGAFTARDLGL
jgi:cytidine deaminase